MKEELEQKLMDEFIFMEERNVWTGNKLNQPKHCECRDGWYDLIYSICKELNNLYVSKGINPEDIFVTQIKEKFGTLRFYTNGLIDGGHEIIEKYEKLSENICEICGAEGELILNKERYQTLCKKHSQ